MRGEDNSASRSSKPHSESPPHARGRQPEDIAAISTAGITPACAGKTSVTNAGKPFVSDHPRMRGEDRSVWWLWLCVLGSPPHARGRLFNNKVSQSRLGITPACAGKTIFRPFRSRATGDHPRMRGEDDQPPVDKLAESGSPPHARGRRNVHHALAPEPGITPACAGKTVMKTPIGVYTGDHPRMRGEDPICMSKS